MIAGQASIPNFPHWRQFKLDTIIRLRWLAVLGQLAAIFIVAFGLEFEVAIARCLGVIAFASVVNAVLQLIYPPVYRASPQAAAALMALTIAELAALLYFTGGLANPFSFLLLGPVLISATTLPPRLTLALGLFAVALATVLGFFHLPLPWAGDDPVVLPWIYLLGVWISISLSIGVTSLYAFQASDQSRKLGDALAAAELILEREQHLTQLDGLAAAAAHELGTPLSTISVIVRELQRNVTPDTPFASELDILREQTNRCRDILSKLSQLPGDGMFDRAPLSAVIEEVAEPHRNFDIDIAISAAPGNAGEEPMLARSPAVLHALGNLVENAVDFARSRVSITLQWDINDVSVVIADDGPGIPPSLLGRIGEPYLTRRNAKSAAAARGTDKGLGLGLFIAKSFLERSGAQLTFANERFPAHGAIARVKWPRAAVASSRDGAMSETTRFAEVK